MNINDAYAHIVRFELLETLAPVVPGSPMAIPDGTGQALSAHAFGGPLAVLYVVEGPEASTYVTEVMRMEAGLSPEALRAVGITNLERRSTGIRSPRSASSAFSACSSPRICTKRTLHVASLSGRAVSHSGLLRARPSSQTNGASSKAIAGFKRPMSKVTECPASATRRRRQKTSHTHRRGGEPSTPLYRGVVTFKLRQLLTALLTVCLLYTSDAADD